VGAKGLRLCQTDLKTYLDADRNLVESCAGPVGLRVWRFCMWPAWKIFQWPRHFQLRKGNLERETTFGNIKKIINSYGDFSACRQTGFPSDAGGFGAART
jgi:hypothetical protein